MAANHQEIRIYRVSVDNIIAILRSPQFCVSLNFEMKSENPIAGGIWYRFHHGMTMSSYGEKITVTLSSLNDGSVQTTVHSECGMPTQMVDWGKNKSNVEIIFNYIESALNQAPQSFGTAYYAPLNQPEALVTNTQYCVNQPNTIVFDQNNCQYNDDQYNNQYNYQYGEPYNDQYNYQYSEQYNDPYNNQYSEQYNDQYNNQYSEQYSAQYNDQCDGSSYSNYNPCDQSVPTEKTSQPCRGLAMASMILGFIALGTGGFTTGILSIIFAIVSKSCGNESKMPVIGAVCSFIAMALWTIGVALVAFITGA